MADSAIANARQLAHNLTLEIEHTVNRLEHMRERLNEAQAFIRQWEKFAAVSASHNQHDRLLVNRHGPYQTTLMIDEEDSVDRSNGNSRKEEVALEARRIIKAIGMPIGKPHMLAHLTGAGLRINGADPQAVIHTMLWRTRMNSAMGIIYLRNFGYWVREMPFPPAGYHPATYRDTQSDD